MRLAIWILVAAALSAATHEKVGQVKEVRGKWCRAGVELRKADDIFLDDDIRYCSRQLSRAEGIVITFLKNPPFDRPYECSSAGLCDKRTKLWIEGGYYFGAPPSPRVPPLLSRPNVSSVLPDLVLPKEGEGVKLPAGAVAWGESFTICQVEGTKQGACFEDQVKRSSGTVKVGTGLYALYVGSNSGQKTSPNALMLVTPGNSDLTKKWDAVPEAVRMSKSAAFVQERRSYLVDLNYTQQKSTTAATGKN
jgi:hypothetical protein